MTSPETVAITGASGFIGRHLLPALVREGYQSLSLGRKSSHSPENPGTDGATRFLALDLRDETQIRDVLATERPDVLIHLAGTRGHGDPAGNYAACVELNTLTTVRLLKEATGASVRRIIIMGTAEEYGGNTRPLPTVVPDPLPTAYRLPPTGLQSPQQEDIPLRPSTPYGITKAAATQLAQAMHQTDGCPVVILRPFTVYGPGQPATMFVAEAVECAVHDLAFEMSEGTQKRDLIYIDDVVAAILAAVSAPSIEGRVINVGSGQARALRDAAALIWKLSGSNAPLQVGARETASHELHDTWADISLAHKLLGWAPSVDLEAGLRCTIQTVREQMPATGLIAGSK